MKTLRAGSNNSESPVKSSAVAERSTELFLCSQGTGDSFLSILKKRSKDMKNNPTEAEKIIHRALFFAERHNVPAVSRQVGLLI